MELRDGAGRLTTYLRMSITDRCNLRCKYCMPEDGYELCAHEDVLSLEEFAESANRFVRLFGINKVRLTGGEPLVKRNIEFLIEKLASNPGINDLAITTNGILLAQKGQSVFDAGMRRINVSLDTLNSDKFNQITRIGNLDDSLKGLHVAKEIGFSPIKINTVLLPGYNEETQMIEWANREGFRIRFIELMSSLPPVNKTVNGDAPRMPDILDRLSKSFGKIEKVDNSSYGAGNHTMKFRIPANNWIFEFIPAMTNHFCLNCNRIRLNCEGLLRYCLYSDETLRIRPLLKKSDDEFKTAIQDFIGRKNSRGSDHIASYMFSIGG